MLDTRHQLLVRASVAASRPSFRDELREAIAASRDSGSVTREEIYECFLQVYLFVGFPAALEAMRALEKLWPRSGDTLTTDARNEVDRYPEFLARGEQLYRTVYAKNAEIVEREMLRLSPDLAAWAVVEGYGKTLSRPGLAMPERELSIVGILTQLSWERQLFSHILGARNVGASNEDIRQAIAIGAKDDKAKRARAEELLARASE